MISVEINSKIASHIINSHPNHKITCSKKTDKNRACDLS